MESNRPVHHGITEFALWGLVQTQGEAILAGRRVKVLSASASMDKGEGWYNVQVKDVEIGDTRWIYATTETYKQIVARRRRARQAARREKKKRAWIN